MVKRIDCEPGLDDRTTVTLVAGDAVSVSGELLTIRDATAKRLFDLARPATNCPSTSRAGCCTPSARLPRSQARSSARRDPRRRSGS